MAPSHQVIALISGGKDSVFSILHCLANGHRVIALGNLYPAGGSSLSLSSTGDAKDGLSTGPDMPEDIDSHMYQTVGHRVIPLFEEAFGIPLYRQEIQGSAVDTRKSYRDQNQWEENCPATSLKDEAESLVPLLRRILQEHPEADAVCTGAILSDYQRTRVETIAVRLGLTPLSYLWQYPSLPPGTPASLLVDMMDVGQESRIIKCASGGLDATSLWENVASQQGIMKLTNAMARFGGLENGALLGEGGEFETIAIDGPPPLWKKRILIDEEQRQIVEGGGGSVFLKIAGARLISKVDQPMGSGEAKLERLRIPDLLDDKFDKLLDDLHRLDLDWSDESRQLLQTTCPNQDAGPSWLSSRGKMTWLLWGMIAPDAGASPHSQASEIVNRLRAILNSQDVSTDNIYFTTIYLRSMDSFPDINRIYATLFSQPNPPSRVTVGLGDSLPPGVEIMLSVLVWLGPRDRRESLHVQSKSYWAPANIGPYSQAVSVPAAATTTEDLSSGALVYIAGQIPLVPASLDVVRVPNNDRGLNAETSHFCLKTVLSLQHLWRIGVKMKVHWWASAIAFVVAKDTTIRSTARVVWEAWRRCHSRGSVSAQDDRAEDERFDVWDHQLGHLQDWSRKRGADHQLPNFEMVDVISTSITEPSFLMVQVDALPRGCDVEWAAVGVAGARVAVSGRRDDEIRTEHCILRGTDTTIFQATIPDELGDQEVFSHLRQIINEEARWPTTSVQPTRAFHNILVTIYTTRNLALLNLDNVNVVYCKSVWASGQKLAAGVVITGETD